MFDDLPAWWMRQMLALLPARLRRGGAGDAVLLDLASDRSRVGLTLRRRGQTSERGRFALDAAGLAALRAAAGGGRPPTVLRIAPDAVLERRLTLPLAAERGLAGMLGYEMDRLTPFAAAEVHYAWTVERRDAAQRRLGLRLLLVPRAALGGVVATLAAAGLPPVRLETSEAVPRVIPLLAHRPPLAGWRGAALAVAVGLAVGAAAAPFVGQALAMRDLDRRIATLRPKAERAQALRRQVEARAHGGDLLAAEQARVGDALAVLATLTTKLPDDTYLTDFRLQTGRLALDGESGSAARLIPTLAAKDGPGGGLIQNPAFAAPVTRLPDRAADLFPSAPMSSPAPPRDLTLPEGRAGQLLALGVTLLVLAALWFAVLAPLIAWHAERDAALAGQRTLAAHLAVLAASLPARAREAAAPPPPGTQQGTLLEGDSDAVAGARLQEQAQALAAAAGVSLASVEVLPAVATGRYRRIGLRLALTAPWPVLVRLLQAIERAHPRMLVDDLHLHAARILGASGALPVGAEFSVLGFRPAPTK